MQPIDYANFALMRSELQRDYTPANAQERMLVDEVAHCWRRLEQARNREELFFDLQKTTMAIRCGESPDAFKEDGGEVRMWIDDSHKGYDQVLRAIRDAGVAYDRAVRRIEQVRDRRLARERADRKDEARAKPVQSVATRSQSQPEQRPSMSAVNTALHLTPPRIRENSNECYSESSPTLARGKLS
jgi:hypothetical protein